MIGTTIGKYHVLDRVGRGGMGTVYRAVDETLHREVAIKVLNSELNDPEVARRFRAEAVTVARLSHPGLATIYELFQHDGQWMMVMEFVRGETLERLVERMGALSPQRAAELCMQALTALAHAHSMGVIHRDLKPANLMITEAGAVKIMDFGIARVSGAEHLTSAGFMMGTPAYMAPEQVLGQEIDARADLYALGVVFYRLTTAKLPFKGETPFAMAQSQVNDPPTPLGMLRADLPSWADQVVQRALAKAPADRFQSAVEFYEAFSRCLAGLPMSEPYNPSGPTELLHTPARPMPTAATAQGTWSGQAAPPMPTGGHSLPPAYGSETATRMTASGRNLQPGATAPFAVSGTHPANAAETVMAPGPATAGPITAPVTAPPAVAAKKGGNTVSLVLAAVVILLVAVLAFQWFRARREQSIAPVTTDAATTPTPTPIDTPIATPTPDATATPTPTPTAVATATPVAAVAASPTPTPTATRTPRPTPTATPSSTPTPVTTPAASSTPDADARGRSTPTPTPTPAVADEHLTFSNVKLLTVSGSKAQDQDVLISFVGGQISVTSKSGGTAIVSMPYRSIAHGTYIHAKDPKWDATLPAPTGKMDMPGFIRTSHHWLTLQTHTAFVILRMEDDNWERIVQAVEARAAMKIERLQDKDK